MNRKKSIVYLSRYQLEPHPDNPRKDLGDLTELRESIRFEVGDQQIGDLRVIKVWSEEPFIEIDIQEAAEALNDIIGGDK